MNKQNEAVFPYKFDFPYDTEVQSGLTKLEWMATIIYANREGVGANTAVDMAKNLLDALDKAEQ